jgi:hypothetical protein
MANFFTRALDWITPGDRGGEAQRRQEKKKREEEERAIRQAQTRNTPQVRRPQNNFAQQESLQTNSLDTPLPKPSNTIAVPRAPEIEAYEALGIDDAPRVASGRGVLRPEVYAAKNRQELQNQAAEIKKSIPKPKQSLANKFRDVIDANTEADQYRRAVDMATNDAAVLRSRGMEKDRAVDRALNTARIMSKAPERTGADDIKDFGTSFARGAATVPSALGRIVTGVGEGVTDLVGFGGTAINAPIQLLRNGSVRGSSNNILANSMREIKDRVISPVSRGLDSSALAIGGEGNMPAYKAAQVAGEVVGGVATLGASASKYAPKAAQVFKLGEAAETSKLASAIKFIDNLVNSPVKSLLNGIRGGGNIAPEVNVIEDILTNTDLDDLARTNIPVRENIPIVEQGVEEAVNVRNVTPQSPLIREVGGDARTSTRMPTSEELTQRRIEQNIANQPAVRPDGRIEGVSPPPPKYLGEAGGVTKVEVKTERAMLDEALKNGEINKTQHKAANKALDEVTPTDTTPPEGKKITVKQVDNIPVKDETVIPQNLPEKPGTVRASTSTAPANAKSEAVAKSPTPIPVPKVGSVGIDGKAITKRDVAKIRRDNKSARAYAKEQEKNAELLSKIEKADPKTRAASQDGFAPTGKYRKGVKGNTFEAGSKEAEAALGAKEMANRPTTDLLEEVSQKGQITQGDTRKIRESLKKLKDADGDHYRQNPEYNALDDLLKQGNSDAARQMALIERVQRRTASSDALVSRWDKKISNALDDPTKIKEEDIVAIRAANDEFTTARDNARKAEEAFRQNDTIANEKAYQQAQDAEKAANTKAIDTELTVAKRLLSGEKSPNAKKVIDDLETEADIKMMDYVTASQLSGPATGFRNLVGTEAAGLENRFGANIRARISKNLFKEDSAVGGFDRAGARAGRKEGFSKMTTDYKRRQDYAGKNPLKHAQNIGTTMNTAGDSSMASQVQSKLSAYYKSQLKSQGYSGEQLTRRTEFMRRTDPDNMGRTYQDAVMKSSGLTGIFGKAKKVEGLAADSIAKSLEATGLVPSVAAGKVGRALSRIALGYPTATGNFLWQSGKRASFGAPSLIEMGVHLKAGNKAKASLAFDNFLKEAGSGAAMTGLGVALGKAGMVSGPYPESESERKRWEREGISEHSIKIGNDWRPIPQGLGMFGLPIMVGAAIGKEGDSNASLGELFSRTNITKLMPQDQVQGFMKLLAGDGTEAQEKNFVASTIRSGVPLGALFNQVAKGLDPTKNDTTTRSFWRNVFDQVVTGIPGNDKFADIPDKTDDEGNVIRNPSFGGVMTGASSTSQSRGEQRTNEINASISSDIEKIDEYGLLKDKSLSGVLEGKALEAFNKSKSGKQLDESDIKSLQSGLTKGVTGKEDIAYLEREQYDTNLSVLKLKRDLMESDPSTKPSSLEDIDTAIKRGEIYKKDQVPYDLISDYKSIGVEDWRKMGIPPGAKGYDEDVYDPEMYQRLWEIDEKMTNSGVSYGKKLDKQKYSEKKSGSGSGGRGGGSGSGSRKISTDFGTLKDTYSAPKVKEYSSIDTRSGSIPSIRVKRPNIVHKITRGR